MLCKATGGLTAGKRMQRCSGDVWATGYVIPSARRFGKTQSVAVASRSML